MQMWTGQAKRLASKGVIALISGFYFAVQSGGDFEVDFVIMDPDDRVLLEGQKERQGDYIFTANKVGEYSFCFENEASVTDKLLDFE